MKKILSFTVLLGIIVLLTGCWPGEVTTITDINRDGSGTKTYELVVWLSGTNFDDPDEDEGKGAIDNDKYIVGDGVEAIQTWLEANAPDWATISRDDRVVEGLDAKVFVLSYDFTDFDDYLAKYAELVNLSPTLSWDDFDETEIPSLVTEEVEVDGAKVERVTYTESLVMVQASIDWAIQGIFNDDSVFDEADLVGFIGAGDISKVAGVIVNLGEESTLTEYRYYDADIAEGQQDLEGNELYGKVVYPSGDADGLFIVHDDVELPSNTLLFVGIGVVAVLAVAGVVLFVTKRK